MFLHSGTADAKILPLLTWTIWGNHVPMSHLVNLSLANISTCLADTILSFLLNNIFHFLLGWHHSTSTHKYTHLPVPTTTTTLVCVYCNIHYQRAITWVVAVCYDRSFPGLIKQGSQLQKIVLSLDWIHVTNRSSRSLSLSCWQFILVHDQRSVTSWSKQGKGINFYLRVSFHIRVFSILYLK